MLYTQLKTQTPPPQIYENIFTAIAQAKHILLVMHKDPDGDTVGASLALAHYLDEIKKPFRIFCQEVPAAFYFLPSAAALLRAVTGDLTNAAFDLVIILDTSDLKRSGLQEYVTRTTPEPTIINIDHHATNNLYGHYNLVDAAASSTCEIVHGLLKSQNAHNKNIATCLLTGLLTDTGGFTNLATTASSLATAAQLLAYGVNLYQLTSKTINNQRLDALKLWGRALERLQPTTSGLAVTLITQQDLRECAVGEEAAEGISNFLNSLDAQTDAPAVLVLTELADGSIKGSLRTTHPLIDVSKLAILLGGGGHKKAAGFCINGCIATKKVQT